MKEEVKMGRLSRNKELREVVNGKETIAKI